MSLGFAGALLLLLAVSCSALPSSRVVEEEWNQSALIMEGEGLHSRMAPMGPMVEPSGEVGRDECMLRSIDRVLRQHKTKFQTVQDAMDTFSDSLSSIKQKHVARYLRCVIGLGMMLPDCTMMPWDQGVKVTDIKAYLMKSDQMAQLVKAATSADGFGKHMKDVEGVVCDKDVMDAVQGQPDKKVAGQANMSSMKMSDDKSSMGGMNMVNDETSMGSSFAAASQKMKMGNDKTMGNDETSMKMGADNTMAKSMAMTKDVAKTAEDPVEEVSTDKKDHDMVKLDEQIDVQDKKMNRDMDMGDN